MLCSYQKPLTGKTVGVVFGSFAPLHQGHLDLIMEAKKENDAGCIVIVCGYDGDKGEPLMPHSKRYRYVREFFADDDLVAVYAINDTEIGIDKYPNGWDGWMKEVEDIYENAVDGVTRRHWYVGEDDYFYDLIHRNENVTCIERNCNPISGTMIRENPIKHWDKIAAPFRRVFSHNILITGTASEGKSTLVTDLGKYFNAPHSYEWAKDNYMKNSCISDWELDGADFIAFLEGQYNLNKELINSPGNHGIFFADTDALVTRMYAEYYSKDKRFNLTSEEFDTIATMADQLAKKSRWDKIFIIAPHGMFVDDHVRFMEHSDIDTRKNMFAILYRNIYELYGCDKIQVLDGTYWENFQTVVNYVKGVIEHGKP